MTDHDESRTIEFRGVRVTVSLRSLEYADLSGTDPNTVVVWIDTDNGDADTPIPLSVHINDSDLWEGLVPGTTNLDGIQPD